MSKRPGNKEIRKYFHPKAFRTSSLSDADIDRMVDTTEGKLEEVARRELALRHTTDVSDVISVRYPNLAMTPNVGRDDIYVKFGRDGHFRFSSYAFHHVFVTRNHLSTHTATWNMITDEVDEGDWEEWPYRHIVSVEAGPLKDELPALDRKSRKRLKKRGPNMAVVGYYFAVRNSGGGQLRASIEDAPIRLLLDEKDARDDRISKRQEAMSDIAQHFKSCQRRLRDILRDREIAASRGDSVDADSAIPPPPLRPLPDMPQPFTSEADEPPGDIGPTA